MDMPTSDKIAAFAECSMMDEKSATNIVYKVLSFCDENITEEIPPLSDIVRVAGVDELEAMSIQTAFEMSGISKNGCIVRSGALRMRSATVDIGITFDQFWKEYPKKERKDTSRTSWSCMLRGKYGKIPTGKEIMNGVVNYAAYVKSSGTRKMYIMYAYNFFIKGVWMEYQTLQSNNLNPCGFIDVVKPTMSWDDIRQKLGSASNVAEWIKAGKPDIDEFIRNR